MSSSLDVHMVMTGHSLGRNKLEHLLASGRGGFVCLGLGGCSGGGSAPCLVCVASLT